MWWPWPHAVISLWLRWLIGAPPGTYGRSIEQKKIDILSYILCDNSPNISSDNSLWYIVWHSFGHIYWHSVWHSFWHSFWHMRQNVSDILSRGWGRARNTGLSGREHWPPMVPVEVWQGTLAADGLAAEGRGWGQAGNTGIRSSRLARQGNAQMVAVEVRHKTLDVAARGCCGGEGGGRETSDSTFCSALHFSIVSEVWLLRRFLRLFFDLTTLWLYYSFALVFFDCFSVILLLFDCSVLFFYYSLLLLFILWLCCSVTLLFFDSSFL